MLNIKDAIAFPFKGPHAWPNIGLLMVCMFIPIVGPIVILGFQSSVEKQLVFNIQSDARRFDFGKFGFYLQRGLGAFLISIIVSVLIVPIIWLTMFGAFVSVAASRGEPLVVVLAILGAIVIAFTAGIVISIIAAPFYFRALVGQTVGEAFDFSFAIDYLKRVGFLTLLAAVIILLVTIPLMFIVCIPFVGYAVFPILSLMQSHLRAQIYQAYLDRGGRVLTIVPDMPDMPPPAFPVQMHNQPPQPPYPSAPQPPQPPQPPHQPPAQA